MKLRHAPALLVLMLLVCIPLDRAQSQAQSAEPQPPAPQKGMIMLTIFLRHDQSKTLDEINAHLKQTGFDKMFPPAGTEVVSWYVMMGIGQVVTLRFHPSACATSISPLSTAPGAAIAPSSTRPTTTNRCGRLRASKTANASSL